MSRAPKSQRAKSAPVPLAAGQVYVAHYEDRDISRHRRIIGLLGGGIVYSTGGDSNGLCKVQTFRDWIRRTHAVRVDERRAIT